MAVWKVARSTKVCALTGKPLPANANVVTALYGAEEEVSEDKARGTGFARKDFLVDEVAPDALADALKGAFCTWRWKTPPEAPKAPRLDLGLARELLERLLAARDPEKAAVMMALALLLVRKRQLALVSEKEGRLVLRWPKSDETFEVASVAVTEAEETSLQQELSRLFEV